MIEKDYLHFSNSFRSPLPHTHLLFYLSYKKNILKEVEKKEENILYTLSSSHYHPRRHLLSLSLLEKQTKIRKGSKNKKEKRKGEEILEIFLRYITLNSFIFLI